MRVGLGAAILPKPSSNPRFLPLTRIHITYARKVYEGHGGARKFWRICLPRLKYHNPALFITVKQTKSQEGPAILSLYFNNKAVAEASGQTTPTPPPPPPQLEGEEQLSDSFAPPPAEWEIVRTINLKRKTIGRIWEDFKLMTGVEEIPISPEDQAEIEKVKRQRELSDLDRKRVAENRQMIKDQEKLLEASREDLKKLREQA
ncbi:50S ribosomal protein Mrp49 [Paracoccidioides lutzii Pb01]|uniref:50S ribosomal protein Mrp49 n=1 Tax=Paracoccidioides lutzii (strain ATCC MYA-826 / Pb01) TaxID=502779 RepID=C1H2M1_PARBA|nr:50S ribosomal protein Mrp49 [Paracoccidioides lutzii Pb01]EEH33965.2 50S ribosomal protein Mrp49 [Paracoccidioides lutzii Pb01]